MSVEMQWKCVGSYNTVMKELHGFHWRLFASADKINRTTISKHEIRNNQSDRFMWKQSRRKNTGPDVGLRWVQRLCVLRWRSLGVECPSHVGLMHCRPSCAAKQHGHAMVILKMSQQQAGCRSSCHRDRGNIYLGFWVYSDGVHISMFVFYCVSHIVPPCPALFLSYGYHIYVSHVHTSVVASASGELLLADLLPLSWYRPFLCGLSVQNLGANQLSPQTSPLILVAFMLMLYIHRTYPVSP